MDSFQSVHQSFLMLMQSQHHLIQLTLDILLVEKVPGNSRINRIDYTNDTETALYRSNMGVSAREHGMFSSSFFGYIFGGYAPRKTNVNVLIIPMILQIQYREQI